VIPAYELLRVVGCGSFGEVWLARHGVLGVFHAVKIVWLRRAGGAATETADRQRELADRALHGLKVFLRLIPPGRSPGIAVLHVGSDPAGRFFYYVMELADDAETGRDIDPQRYVPLTLRELCRRAPGGRLTAEETIRHGARLASGLVELHQAGLVHRDIKPSNIVFVRGEPLLADIDLARPSDATLSIGGTPDYVPPEGPGRPTADIFSLGRTLYVAATGLDARDFPRLPDDWDRRPDVAARRELTLVLLRACDDAAGRRFPAVAGLRDELRLLEAGQSAQGLRRLERLGKWATRVALVAVPVALLAGGIAWREVQNRRAIETEQRAKTAALYGQTLTVAAARIEQGKLGSARRTLAEAAQHASPGLEAAVLARQSQGETEPVAELGLPVEGLAIGPDGSRIGIITEQADRSSATCVIHLPGGDPLATVSPMARLAGFLGDGRSLAGTKEVGSDRFPAWWPLPQGEPVFAHEPGVNRTVAVLTDGRTLAFLNDHPSHGRLGALGFWDTASGSLSWKRWGAPPTNSTTGKAAISAKGDRFLHLRTTGDRGTFVSRLHYRDFTRDVTGLLTVPELQINALALSADGRRAAYAIKQSSEVFGYPTDGGATNRVFLPFEPYSLAWSPEARWLAVGGAEGGCRVLRGDDLSPAEELGGLGTVVKALDCDPTGRWLFSGDSSGSVRQWDIAGPPPARGVWEGFRTPDLAQLIASPDGALVAVPGGPASVRLLDGRSLAVRAVWTNLSNPLRFDARAQNLWALTPAGELARVRVADGAVIDSRPLFRKPVPTAFGLASPDGRYLLAFSSNRVARWRLEPVPEPLDETVAHTSSITDLAFAADASSAITLADMEAVLWDFPDSGHRNRHRKFVLDEEAFCACFLPGSRTCLLGTKSNQLLVLDTSKGVVRTNIPLPSLSHAYQMIAGPDARCVLVAGNGGQLVALGADASAAGGYRELYRFAHPGLAARPGAHAFTRLLLQPGTGRLLGHTEDGLLVRW